MTVPESDAVIPHLYTGPGSYPFPFKIFDTGDLQIVHTDETGIPTPLELGVDYEVVISQVNPGGDAIINNPVDPGGSVILFRQLPIEQATVWRNNSAFNQIVLESDLDKIIMICQQLQSKAIKESIMTRWTGDWISGYPYKTDDIIRAPNSNIYVCAVEHTSSNFDSDLNAGYWTIFMDLQYIEQLRDETVAAAEGAAQSETEAEQHKIDAGVSEVNAEESKVAAEESETCSLNWASRPEDDPIPPPCGTGAQFSSFHWSEKARKNAIMADGRIKLNGSGSVLSYLYEILSDDFVTMGEILAINPNLFEDYFTKTDFLSTSGGVVDAARPIVLDGTGKIDPSMLTNLSLVYVSVWNPSGGTEYPDSPGNAEYWLVNGVDPSTGYTFTGGDLSGSVANNGDFMLYGGSGWSLLESNMDPTQYLLLDGSNPMSGNLLLGTHQIKQLAPGSESTDAATIQQIQDYSDGSKLSVDGSNAMQAPLNLGTHSIIGLTPSAGPGEAVEHQQIIDVLEQLTQDYYTANACDAIFVRKDIEAPRPILYLDLASGIQVRNGIGDIGITGPAGLSFTDRYDDSKSSEEDQPMITEFGVEFVPGVYMEIPFYNNCPKYWDGSAFSIYTQVYIPAGEECIICVLGNAGDTFNHRLYKTAADALVYEYDTLTMTLNGISEGTHRIGIFSNGASVKFYLDGDILEEQNLPATNITVQPSNIYIGASDNTGADSLNGHMIKFQLFEAPLTANQSQGPWEDTDPWNDPDPWP